MSVLLIYVQLEKHKVDIIECLYSSHFCLYDSLFTFGIWKWKNIVEFLFSS